MSEPAPLTAEPTAQPKTCLPDWGTADLPEPTPLSWRRASRLIGPGIVMMGVQIGGGEWLMGPEVTAKYGGALMWIATIAIVLQVFYNMECGRYALYCGEPIFTGMMRTRPGPLFWMAVILFLSFSSLIPGLSTHGAAMLVALILDRPPGEEDRWMVMGYAYLLLFAVALPVFAGGKIYNALRIVMTLKVFTVLSFCLILGVLLVSPANWLSVFSGFLKFGTVPTVGPDGTETTVNVFQHWFATGSWPLIALGNIAVVGAFAGYAGGGGMSNAAYGNYVRDQGWGMGRVVGAIPSMIGGRHVTLSHLGTAFPLTKANLERWRGWWRYVILEQCVVWAPGCFMGMALPALLSMQFAPHSTLGQGLGLEWAQALITADGMRHDPRFSQAMANLLWMLTIIVGLMVMLPSQLSIVDDFSRRWTDIIWSGSRRVRQSMRGGQVARIYYAILVAYIVWTAFCAYLFSRLGTPKLMVLIIANFNNLAIGVTALHLLWINRSLLPAPLRPQWWRQLGLFACGAFYLGLAALVFATKQWPVLRVWIFG